MMHTQFRILLLLVLLLGGGGSLRAQFYNGLQMTFGKNRVQYNLFEWQYYRFERFDVYYYAEGRELAQFAATYTKSRLADWENFFNAPLQSRIIFLVYNKHSEFKQSNIGLVTGNSDYNMGGTSVISDNKVFLYFDGNHQHFKQQIDARLVELLLQQSIYGTTFSERMAAKSLIDLPEWYTAGLIGYLSEGWSDETEALVTDHVRKKKFKRLNGLQDEKARLAGMAIWNYVSRTYGRNVLPSIIYLTKAHKSYEAGFNFVTGDDFRRMLPEWLDFYLQENQQNRQNRPDSVAQSLLRRPKTYLRYQQPSLSPKGDAVAYTTNNSGRVRVWIADRATGKRRSVFRRFHRLQQITDYSFPQIAWHPNNEILAFVTEEKGKLWLYFYDRSTRQADRRYLDGLDKVNSLAFAPDGLRMLFSGSVKGRTDIYLYNVPARTLQALTNDDFDDFDPQFVDRGTKVAFVSNRIDDTLRTEKRPLLWAESPVPTTAQHTDVFVYNLQSASPVLQRLSDTPHASEFQPVGAGPNKYVYLSDANGLKNRYVASYDSTISHIDTTVHYRYFARAQALTNYQSTIFGHSLIDGLGARLNFENKRYQLYTEPIDLKAATDQLPAPTLWARYKTEQRLRQERLDQLARENKLREQQRIDSIRRANPAPHPDSQTLNVNSYVFENEKLVAYQTSAFIDSILHLPEPDSVARPQARNYFTVFYTDYLSGKVDLSFANQFYQAFTGQYFNPGLNFALKLGTKDLFEDMKFVGGLYVEPDLSGYNYLLGVEFLKKRWDKQYFYQEQSYRAVYPINTYYSIAAKHRMYKLTHVSSYPLSQVLALRGTFGGRYDKTVVLSQDRPTLEYLNENAFWANLKGEVVFDNTFVLGTNLNEGARAKVWGEYHQQLGGPRSDMFVLGADLRHYLRIHRNLVWANRFAASTSFGGAKLIYYLGGVDNWWNFSETPTFDQSTPINYDLNYQFQANATNMRGFSQNARNGTTFFVANSELRWPVFSYFSNHLLRMKLLRDFQLVGFADLGSAWNGLSPFDESNKYNYETIQQGDLKIVIHKNRAPIVWSYGFGMRTTFLGYYVRADWAWGVDDGIILPRVFHLSLSYDF